MSLCRRLLRREGWELGLVSGIRPPERGPYTEIVRMAQVSAAPILGHRGQSAEEYWFPEIWYAPDARDLNWKMVAATTSVDGRP